MSRSELERQLEDRCVEKIERLGGQALKLIPIGIRGFPDRTILLRGHVAFVEFKRVDGRGSVAAQQTEWSKRLGALGFPVVVVDSDVRFDAFMKEWL